MHIIRAFWGIIRLYLKKKKKLTSITLPADPEFAQL